MRRHNKFSIWLIVLILAAGMLLTQEAKAADGGLNLPQFGIDIPGPGVKENSPNVQPGDCFQEICGSGFTCNAGDIVSGQIQVYDALDHCEKPGDTGTYRFMFNVFSTTATERYDPMIVFAL